MLEERSYWKEEPYFLLIADLDKLNDNDSFTIARVINGVNCVELHYNEGKATLEYGMRVKGDEWESIVEDIDWYDKDMSEDDISNKLWEIFDVHYGEKKKDPTYAICYDTLYVFNFKSAAKRFFSDCYHSSEGEEQERYASILVDFNFSNTGKDNVSKYCTEIAIKENYSDKFIKLNLKGSLSREDTIKFYKEKVLPILEVSDDYRICFAGRTPLEDFGSDAESYTNLNFSDYYQELLEKFDVKVDNIQTNSRSDGKYTLIINNEKFDITAWDDLEGVIDNVDSMIEFLHKDNEMEI